MSVISIKDLNGDSTVSGLSYKDGIVSCKYLDGESDQRFEIRIKADILFSQASEELGSVHTEVVNLKEAVPIHIESGIYISPEDISSQLKLFKSGFHVALGKRYSEYPFLLLIRGYKVILACPIRSEEDIDILEI